LAKLKYLVLAGFRTRKGAKSCHPEKEKSLKNIKNLHKVTIFSIFFQGKSVPFSHADHADVHKTCLAEKNENSPLVLISAFRRVLYELSLFWGITRRRVVITTRRRVM
jgi:hypothetical protein